MRIRPQRTLGSRENDERQVIPKIVLSRVIWNHRKCGPSSINMSCGKALQIFLGSRLVTCISCNMTMRVDKCPRIFNCQLASADLALSFPVDVASKYFKEDVVELFKKDETGFRMALCLLENADFTYNSKNIITSMTDRPQNVSDV